ncbi:MAG: TIGR04372 family glycosyltransferase [Magnetospirillum sp. WYHS-4]
MVKEPVIAAFLGAQALGDFVMHHVTVASVAQALQGCRLVAIYRDDRPYKKLVTMMNPFVTHPLAASDQPGAMVPLDWFDGRRRGLAGPSGPRWREEGLHAPDVFLTPAMTRMNQCLGQPPALRFPDSLDEAMGTALERLGLQRNRWFVCLHLREEGYRFRGVEEARCVDPRSYLPAILRIIEHHCGQIVRIGDPAMTPMPALPGLIDLSRFPDSFPLQAYATARARFFLGTDSGPTQLACALKTPVATTNCLTATVWNDGDLVVHKRPVLPDGTRLSFEIMREIGHALGNLRPKGLSFRDNSPAVLVRAVDHMVAATADCPEWRFLPSAPPAVGDRVNLPLSWRRYDEIARPVYLDDI